MHATPDLDYFASRLDAPAALADAPGVELVLFEAVPIQHSAPGRPGFSLMFRGPLAPQLEQATYALRWPGQPTLDIFLVPVARTDHAMHYQAIFN